jgi:hypothetical protein
LFLLKDLLFFSFIFTLPPLVASSFAAPELLCRFLAPLTAQYITTPIHIFALTICNYPGAPLNALLSRASDGLSGVILLRQLRTMPAFSIGGVMNGRLRAAARAWLLQ